MTLHLHGLGRWSAGSAAFWILLVLCGSESARAQTSVEVTTFAGIFVPATSVIRQERSDFGSTTVSERKHEPAVAVGGRFTWLLTERFGLEAVAAYIPSDLGQRTSSSFGEMPWESEPSNLSAFSGRGVFRPGPLNGRTTFQVAAGVAALRRGGTALQHAEGTTDLAVVIGAGVRVQVWDRLAVRFDVDDYLSSARFTFVGPPRQDETGQVTRPRSTTGSRFQNDLVFSQGFSLAVGRL